MKVELLDHTADVEEKISEMAAICYDSKGANVKRLKRDGHFATFRFGYATFQISEMSRSTSMQMLRHKFLDFLQRSQRYVKEMQFEYVTPPSIAANDTAANAFHTSMREAEWTYDFLIKEEGIKAEDARYVLPNACYTKMNVTGSIQAWYDFLYGNAGRLQKAAQWEIREVAKEIERHLITISPTVFGRGEGK